VDGSLLSALPLLIEAMGRKEQTASGLVKWRLHNHPLTNCPMATKNPAAPFFGRTRESHESRE
jgi:hypothetical protein